MAPPHHLSLSFPSSSPHPPPTHDGHSLPLVPHHTHDPPLGHGHQVHGSLRGGQGPVGLKRRVTRNIDRIWHVSRTKLLICPYVHHHSPDPVLPLSPFGDVPLQEQRAIGEREGGGGGGGRGVLVPPGKRIVWRPGLQSAEDDEVVC